ncbi:MAG: hypothetical protein ACW99A_09675 [Candidatus Kariarchaeaceae archaeon]
MEKKLGIRNYEDILDRLNSLEEKFDFVLNLGEHHKDATVLDPISSINIEQRIEVAIKPKAYLKMATHALRFANDEIPREEWVEVIGLLTGKLENPNTPLELITVKDYWAIGSGDAVSVNILDAEPVMNVYKNKPKNDFILGWAHSHPSYTPFLSQDDINTQLRYQALWEDSIAVVIDPAMITKINHGYSVFRLTEARDIYYEVKNKIEGMSATAAYQALNLLLKEKGIKAGQFN